jgi:2-polyprenyl-6-methoxyphenol hydroxylase-like FAD-dependent oxidoreductase
MHAPLHVLIAGGGLGGLALAHGLIKAGLTVEVFERDADLDRRQGYYLTINGLGGEALRAVLPEDLFELYLDTSRRPYPSQASIVLSAQLEELGRRPSLGPPNLGERRHTGVHRRTLRQILAARLDDVVRYGVSAVGYDEDVDGVTLHLSDGSTARGDLLVAADGIRSRVRDQKLPGTHVVSTAIKGIDLYGRTPYTEGLLAEIPDQLHDSMLIATDGRARCLMGSFRARRPVAVAVAERAPDVHVDPVDDYMMVSCSVAPGTVVPPTAEWTPDTPAMIRASMESVVAEWHPAVRAIVAGLDLDSIFAISFSYLVPQPDWTPSRVSVLGDAAHGMLPTLGMGANTAFQDARTITERVTAASRGEMTLVEAIGGYEAVMREHVYPLIPLTVDHDRVFGGGALARADES